jgi:hypothetical protein
MAQRRPPRRQPNKLMSSPESRGQMSDLASFDPSAMAGGGGSPYNRSPLPQRDPLRTPPGGWGGWGGYDPAREREMEEFRKRGGGGFEDFLRFQQSRQRPDPQYPPGQRYPSPMPPGGGGGMPPGPQREFPRMPPLGGGRGPMGPPIGRGDISGPMGPRMPPGGGRDPYQIPGGGFNPGGAGRDPSGGGFPDPMPWPPGGGGGRPPMPPPGGGQLDPAQLQQIMRQRNLWTQGQGEMNAGGGYQKPRIANTMGNIDVMQPLPAPNNGGGFGGGLGVARAVAGQYGSLQPLSGPDPDPAGASFRRQDLKKRRSAKQPRRQATGPGDITA